jgi:hypothetical protein
VWSDNDVLIGFRIWLFSLVSLPYIECTRRLESPGQELGHLRVEEISSATHVHSNADARGAGLVVGLRPSPTEHDREAEIFSFQRGLVKEDPQRARSEQSSDPAHDRAPTPRIAATSRRPYASGSKPCARADDILESQLLKPSTPLHNGQQSSDRQIPDKGNCCHPTYTS